MIEENKNSLLLSKNNHSYVGFKKPPEMGIEPRTFGFLEVYIDNHPHVGKFLGPYEWLLFDNNKLFLFLNL